jgi:ubiquinone/menaquinone biosynthesis C-methylase UbiE
MKLKRFVARLLDPWLFQVGAWPYDWMTANRVWQQSSADLLTSLPDQAQGTTVLDLGIGPGVSALGMGMARPGLRFVGVDISRPMLKLAGAGRARAGWPASRLMLLQADAARLPLPGQSLDAAAGHSFLYLLPDHPAVLRETARVLRPGGWAAFMEPNAGRADWRWLLRQGSGKLLVSVSLWRFYNWLHGRFSPESMTEALARAGFADVSTESTLGGFGIYGRASKR